MNNRLKMRMKGSIYTSLYLSCFMEPRVPGPGLGRVANEFVGRGCEVIEENSIVRRESPGFEVNYRLTFSDRTLARHTFNLCKALKESLLVRSQLAAR